MEPLRLAIGSLSAQQVGQVTIKGVPEIFHFPNDGLVGTIVNVLGSFLGVILAGHRPTQYDTLAIVAVQIALGVSTIWFSVPLVLALSHQAVGLLLFMIAVYIRYEIVHTAVPDQVSVGQTAVAQTGD